MLRRVSSRFRELTASRRLLPQVLLIGAQKAGTTSLYNYLIQHPLVLPGTRKEVRYFNAGFEQGVDWYRSHFPLARARRFAAGDSAPITIDASTGYLPDPNAPKRVAELLPDAKFIVLLRDPVERAWSHYRHSVRKGHESLEFGAALQAESSRLEPYYRAVRAGTPPGREYSHYSYVKRGRYAEQLQRWFEVFAREQFLVMAAEELFAQPSRMTNEVLAFLDLSPLEHVEADAHNAGSGDAMPAAERAWLEAYFEPHNEQLSRLLDWAPAWASSSDRRDRSPIGALAVDEEGARST